jgi:hypothetical protein
MVTRRLAAAVACLTLLAASPAAAEDPPSLADRVGDLQDEIESLTEDIEDLQEPVEEFELFDQCMYLIGVSERGGYRFNSPGAPRRRALSLDIRGFGRPTFQFLAFPAEEPPSIECNEDAGEEDSDD